VFSNFYQCTSAFAYYEAHEDYTLSNSSIGANSTTNGTSVVSDTVTTAAFAFWISFFDIVEYIESNGIPGLQFNDTLISFYDLRRLWIWKPIYHQSVTITDALGSVDIHTFTMETRDAVFRVKFHIAGRPVTYGPAHLNGNAVKIDILIQNYPYVSNSPNVQLGLVAITVAEAERSFVDTNGNVNAQGNVSFSVNGTVGGFSWDGSANASVAGIYETASVRADFTSVYTNASVQANFEASLVIFSFSALRPLWVFWDPQMSVQPNPGTGTGSTTAGANGATTGPNGATTSEKNSGNTAIFSVMTFVLALLLQTW